MARNETIEQLQSELAEKNKAIATLEKALESKTKEIETNLQTANETIEQLQSELAEKNKAIANTIEAATTQVTSSTLSSSATNDNHNDGLIKVVFKYPEDYKGVKHFKDGEERFMSKDAAALFVRRGIAKIS